jgi:regulator of CtrA degradation
LARRLADSQAFSALFREGHGARVRETAAYLDGPVRKESKSLTRRCAGLCHRKHAAHHAADAACLLAAAHRAVKEGEMSLAQAHKEKAKVKLAPGETATSTRSQVCRSG